jgi:8-oxo-dGTP pyrophosphatase MutT (NUDIX family)
VSEPSITRITNLDIRCVERRWPWAEVHAAEIDAFWGEAKAKQPALFDGPVFMFADVVITGATCRAVCFETRFSRLLYAKRLCFPDPEVVNGFAMAALQASDGGYLLGVMGAETANRGQVYFPSGTPDPSDRRPDGTLDLNGSVMRELAEETGLQPGDYEIGVGWFLVRDSGFLAFLRPVSLPHPAAEARARMLGRMRQLKEQELSDIYIAHGPGDIDEQRMPGFILAFLRWVFP